MLENFRKKDVSRPGYTPAPSPFGRMQEALSPAPPVADAPKAELLKAEPARADAAMESRVLQIAEIGEFVGKAAVDTAEIRGRFDGELTVRKQLVIRATGHVSGKIRYGKLSIEEGGELSGDIGAIGPATVSPDSRAALVARASAPTR
jgi:hypothetical protein